MPAQKKRLWLAAIIFIYVAIAVAGFTATYMIKNYFLPHDSSTSAPKVIQVKTADIPAGWKKYTNADLKIAFSYPSKDNLKASSYGFGVTSVSLQDAQGNTDFQILLLPKSLAQAVGQDFASYYAMQNNTTKIIKSPISQDNTTEKFTKIRNRSVNGLEALDYQSIASNAPANEQPEIGTFIATGDNLILISTGSGNKTELEEMLSSLTYAP
jgi:hypothetical protein